MASSDDKLQTPPVAIVGLGCVLPDANNYSEFSDQLLRGHCAIRDLPAHRFDREQYYSSKPGVPGTSYCWRGGIVGSTSHDLSALGLSMAASEALDSFHSIVLRAALETFASARLTPADVRGRAIPVLLGCARATLRGEDHVVARGAAESLLAFDDIASPLSAAERVRVREEALAAIHRRLGGSSNTAWPPSQSHAIAGLIAHAFGLLGRHAVVDSACASTLSALHVGVRLIRQGRADMAMVGGGSELAIGTLVLFSQAGTVGHNGSFPFDQRASGFIPGEGAGMVLLKRFDLAVRDGDRIYGVIRGVASACDGRGKAVWAPRKEGQVRAISRAYLDAGIDPSAVGMIEAHATSTRVGDTTEVAAISECFAPSGARDIPIGSVKGNVGHLIEGAGVPSLLKVLAAFERERIPPSIGYSAPNPDIDWSKTPLRHATEAIPWPRGDRPRIGAVDSFGIGGLNCHVVVEEPPTERRAGELVDLVRRQTPSQRVSIAVVGLGCVLPGANNANELREVVQSQRAVSAITPPANRIEPRVAPPGVKVAVTKFEFDWKAMSVPPLMAAQMDPVHLMTMEASRQVVTDLGGPKRLNTERVAAFMGESYLPDQQALAIVAVRCVEIARELVAVLVRRGMTADQARAIGDDYVKEARRRLPPLNEDTVANSSPVGIVYRIAKLFDVHGPTHCLDAGGSGASLSTVEVGCETLWQDEADLVFCGGGDRSLRLQRLEEVAPNTVASEGVVIFGLKRLPDAQAAGDRIYGVIDSIESAGKASVLPTKPDAAAVESASAFAAFGDMLGVSGSLALARAALSDANDPRGIAVETREALGTSYRVIVKPAPGKSDVVAAVPVVPPKNGTHVLQPAREPLVIRGRSRDSIAATLARLAGESLESLKPGETIGSGAIAIGLRSGPELASRIKLAQNVVGGRVPASAVAARGVALVDVSSSAGPCFLFPGLGSQYPGMLRDLVAAYPAAAARVAEIDRIVAEDRLPSVFDMLADEARLASDTRYTQIAVLAGNLATYDIARTHGIVPTLVSGHSFGDYAALVAVGAWSLQDAIRTAMRRAELIARHAPPAAMISIFASRERVTTLLRDLPGYASPSNINSPDQIVVSGETAAVDALEARCKAEGVEARRLAVPTGFHSEILRPVYAPFARALENVRFERPSIPFLSSTTSSVLDDPSALRKSIVDQLVSPVDFVAQIHLAYSMGIHVFVECGANNILSRLATRILEGRPATIVALDEKRKNPGAELAKLECALAAIRASESSVQPQVRPRSMAQVPEVIIATHVSDPTKPNVVTVDATAKPTTANTDASALFDAEEWQRLSAQPGWNGFWDAARPMLARWATDLFSASIVERRAEPRQAHAVKMIDVTAKRPPPQPRLPPSARRAPAAPPIAVNSAPPQAVTAMATTPATQPVVSPPVVAPAVSPPRAPVNGEQSVTQAVTELLTDLVVQRTGYPRDLVDLDALLEADLGIDTVKQVELLGTLRQTLDLPRDPNVNVGDLQTLRKVRDHIVSRLDPTTILPTDAAAEAPAAAVPVNPDVESEITKLLLDLVVQRTGYPIDMIDMDAQLEADLGIDTVKQVELLGTLRQHLDLPRDPNVNVADLQTLRKVREHVVSRLHATTGITLVAEPVEAPSVVTAERPPENGAHVAGQRHDVEREITDFITDLVVQRTGYPRELIDPDAHLEADLGIDTVKQVELIGAIRQHLDLPRDPNVNVADLHTLRKVRDHVLSRINGTPEVASTNGAPAPLPSAASTIATPPPVADIAAFTDAVTLAPKPVSDRAVARRYVLRTRVEPITGVVTGSYRPARLLVLGSGRVASAIADAMTARGTKVEIVELGDAEVVGNRIKELATTGPFPDLCLTTVLARIVLIAPGIAALASDVQSVMESKIVPTYRAVQAWAQSRGTTEGATLSAITAMGGAFGVLPVNGWLPEGGAIAGLLKSVRRELGVRAKLLDTDPAEDPATVARTLLQELDSAETRVEVGVLRGSRRVPELILAPLVSQSAETKQPRLAVITGGGRGITAHVAVALARAGVQQIALIGRSALRDDMPELRRLAALGLPALRQEVLKQLRNQNSTTSVREWNAACAPIEAALEVDETIRRIEQCGASVQYYVCDVCNRDALAATLARVRDQGPIEAIVHGAGVEFSRAFTTKSLDELERTVATKVKGALNLLALTELDPVKWFAGFSSVSGRFGGFGQADYSLANEWLSRLCAAAGGRSRERRIFSVAWPPWDSVGMAVRGDMRTRLASAGVQFLGVEEGCRHFVQETSAETFEVDVTYATDSPMESQYGDDDRLMPDEAARAAIASIATEAANLPLVDLVRRTNAREVMFECRLDARRDAFLNDHRIDGVAVLPAVVMAELAAEGARLLRPGIPIAALSDFEITGPVKLPHDGQSTVRVTASLRDGRAEIVLTSDVHARGGQLLQVDERRATWRAEYGAALQDRVAPTPVVGKRIPYRYLEPHDTSPDRLRWGPSMRCLKEMIIGTGNRHGAVLQARAPEALRPGRSAWWCPAPLLDGALVMCMKILHHIYSPRVGQLVPVRMSRLAIGRSPQAGEICHGIGVFMGQSGRDFTVDVSIVDESGRLVLAIDGLLARTLDPIPEDLKARPA